MYISYNEKIYTKIDIIYVLCYNRKQIYMGIYNNLKGS